MNNLSPYRPTWIPYRHSGAGFSRSQSASKFILRKILPTAKYDFKVSVCYVEIVPCTLSFKQNFFFFFSFSRRPMKRMQSFRSNMTPSRTNSYVTRIPVWRILLNSWKIWRYLCCPLIVLSLCIGQSKKCACLLNLFGKPSSFYLFSVAPFI